MAEEKAPPGEITENDTLMGLLAYIVPLIAPLIILFSEAGKQRPFQRYHAIHSLGLCVTWVIFGLILSVPACLLGMFSAGLGTCCLLPLYVLPYVAMIYYGIQAYDGRYSTMPLITDFIKGQGWV